MVRKIVVTAIFDPEASVWFTESTDLPGLRLEAATVEDLIRRIPGAIQDLLEDCDGDDGQLEVPVELIAHANTRVRVHGVAA